MSVPWRKEEEYAFLEKTGSPARVKWQALSPDDQGNWIAVNFVGWEKDHALFDRELEKVIRALRTEDGGREKPPPAKL